MKKLYFLLLALGLFMSVNAQSPSDPDPNFNQFNLPLGHYFVDDDVTKSTVLPDGKILIINNQRTLIKLNGNLLDTTFNIGTGFGYNGGGSALIYDFAVQTDGKIIVCGLFSSFNGQNKYHIIRLNPNGSLDNSFAASVISVLSVSKVCIQSDGKILYIYQGSSSSINNIRRLNTNGSLDTSFSAPNYEIDNIALQTDGKIIASHGDLNGSYGDLNRVFRLNTNGTVDLSFTEAAFYTTSSPGHNVYIKKIIVQSDGKILVGGKFRGCNSTSRPDLARLSDNGSLDVSFQIGTGFTSPTNDCVWDIVQQSDTKILVVGRFKNFNNIGTENIARLNQNGSHDATFQNPYSFLNIDSVKSISFFNDGKLLVSGDSGLNKKTDSYIVKLNTDGTKDTSFNNICKGLFDIYYNLGDIVQDANGKILVGGAFYTYNGQKCISFTRLNQDGSIDNSLTYGGLNGFDSFPEVAGSVNAIAPLSNGKIYLGGDFTSFNGQAVKSLIRINSDGTRDESFNIGDQFSSVSEIVAFDNGDLLVFAKNGSYYNLYEVLNSGYVYTYPLFSQGSASGCLKLQPDGKILMGFNGSVIMKRLNSNYTIDTSFNLDPLLNATQITNIDIQQDGKILIVGKFTISGVERSLARIMSNGSLDTSFNFVDQGTNRSVRDVNVLANQKLLITLEDFSVPLPVYRIIRLNNDGTVESLFNEYPTGSNTYAEAFIQNDGKIIISGKHLIYRGKKIEGMIRLMGEDYNFIKGQIKFDLNNNGCDINDAIFTNFKLNVSSGVNNFDYIANTTGNYNLALENGSHTITPVLENPSYFTVSPTNTTVSFPTQASPFTQNFCVRPNGVHSDVEVSVIPVEAARPGFNAPYKIVYKNKGNQVENGSVNLTFDDAKMDYVFLNPVFNSQATNRFTWNYSNLQPFETRVIDFVFNINTSMESLPVNGGDVLNYTASITTANTDELPNDNSFTLNQTVVNSFDPNDITCLEGATVSTAKVGDFVHYIIRFENTGSANATNIVVKDLVDAAKYDINTIIPIKGSHDFFTRINGNNVEFIFESINLAFDDANNDGYLAFKIKLKSTLVAGDTFSKNASIYFDYNFPIVTNTATTTIAALSTMDFEFNSYFSLYPNPVSNILNITSKETIEISSINIYNTLGQLVVVIPNAQNTKTVDVSSLTSGNYFIKINSDKGTSNTKFIKQ
ncbi:MAG: T9SS type A sorting domain-containing protein [Bacteroidota bacterium]